MSVRTKAALLLLVASVAGCTTWLAGPSATPKAAYTLAPATPSLTALATVAPTGHGQPYTAAEIVAMLHHAIATRPAGFASELRAQRILDAMAATVAAETFTFDGRPYQRVVFGARCDQPAVHCELTMDGVPAFSSDSDMKDSYTWTITLPTPLVTMADHSLRGYPAELTAGLDALAQSLDVDGRFKDRYLLGVEWALPPLEDGFVLRYGNGLEEGDPTFLVTLDRAGQRILSIAQLP